MRNERSEYQSTQVVWYQLTILQLHIIENEPGPHGIVLEQYQEFSSHNKYNKLTAINKITALLFGG